MSKVTKDSFTIKTTTEKDKDKVQQFLRQYFYEDEPLNEYLDRERNEKLVSTDRGINAIRNINEGLSIMAVTPLNEIIGVIINRNLKAGSETQKNVVVEDHPNFIKIWKLIGMFEEQLAEIVKLQHASEKEMSLRIISVHPEWRNKGVGYALIQHTLKLAKQNGFDQIQVMCSSTYSAKLFEKVGFHCIHAIKYEDYKENGEAVFKPDLPHTHLKALILKI